MASEIRALREQILANAKFLIQPTSTDAAISTSDAKTHGDLDVVIFNSPTKFVAAVMVGITPAIEGSEGASPEAALLKLLLATTEVLKEYIPTVGTHQRNIHGGGVFDVDIISTTIREAKNKSG